MAITSIAMQAYQKSLGAQRKFESEFSQRMQKPQAPRQDFTDTLKNSITKVNDMQHEKTQMIESFASGENQNVHELMISLQKAGLAMSMTSAVRNKIMSAYKEVMQMQV